MKKSKIIVPALGILVLSTAAAVSGTVAWFTSSNLVSVTGLHAKVDAETGIVISNEARSSWATSTTAQHSGQGQSFMLTSTADLSTWYHNNSNNANEHAAAGDYDTLTVNKPDAGTTDQNTGLGTTTFQGLKKNVYLINRFYIKSASGVELSNQKLHVKNIAATAAGGSAELNKALRVAFVYGSTKIIYGVFEDFTHSYKVGGATQAFEPKDGSLADGADIQELASGITIPSFNTESPLQIETYVYFEGEDEAAKSANITASLDDITISFEFENEKIA